MCRLKPYETGDEHPQRSATSLAKRASPSTRLLATLLSVVEIIFAMDELVVGVSVLHSIVLIK